MIQKLLFVLRFTTSSSNDKLGICLLILLTFNRIDGKEDIGGRKVIIEILIYSRTVKSNLSILSL